MEDTVAGGCSTTDGQQEQQSAADKLIAEYLFMQILLASGYLCRNGNSLSIPNLELREKLKDNIYHEITSE
jgi:hypothetical protein